MYETVGDELKVQLYSIGRHIAIAGNHLSTPDFAKGSHRSHFQHSQRREYAGWPDTGLYEPPSANAACFSSDRVRLLAAQDRVSVDGFEKQEHE